MANKSAHAQIPIRTRGNKKCTSHHGKDVVYFCETCTGLVCGDCVTKNHKGHDFAELETVIPKAKEKIQTFVNKLEKTDIPLINEEIENVEKDLSTNAEHFQREIKLIREKNDLIKDELDNITEMMVKTCQSMEDISSYTFLNHKKKLSALRQEMTSHFDEFKEFLLSEDNVLVYDMSNAIPSNSIDLQKPKCTKCKKVSFKQGKFSLKTLEDMIGELRITNESQTRRPLEQPEQKNKSSLQRKVEDLFKSGKRLQQEEEDQTHKFSYEPKFQAISDYKASEVAQISFKKDEILHDVFIIDKNWMEGTVARTRISGRFPANSIKRIPDKLMPGNQTAERRSTSMPMYSTLCDFEATKEEDINFVTGDI